MLSDRGTMHMPWIQFDKLHLNDVLILLSFHSGLFLIHIASEWWVFSTLSISNPETKAPPSLEVAPSGAFRLVLGRGAGEGRTSPPRPALPKMAKENFCFSTQKWYLSLLLLLHSLELMSWFPWVAWSPNGEQRVSVWLGWLLKVDWPDRNEFQSSSTDESKNG